ncbi:protein S100-G-like isoform X1 [Stegastes partitus]|uniref:Protein S100-G-like isoform X1 n=1 Tax=Stegastes partitus TaxID=144197 RepID=A0A9Y4MSE1_9TELE|nr:PREDICTED: protein S100-G-like isoform X1 [Stegastes partitus]XP_008278907.1 PREDICTED: protein S100-G-like isoform X1 [Stegastes partitus]
MADDCVQEKFDKYAGNDGLLSEEELRKMIETEIGDDCRMKERLLKRVPKIIKRKDDDGDGQLSFEEFKVFSRLVKKLQEKKEKGQPLDDDSE